MKIDSFLCNSLLFFRKFRNMLLLASVFLLLPGPIFADTGLSFPDKERCAATKESSPFALNVFADIGLGLAGAGLFATAAVIRNDVEGYDGDGKFKEEDINSFDKLWFNGYDKTLDDLGNIGPAATLLALPVGIYLTETIVKNFPARELATVGVMFAESWLLSTGIKNIMKTTFTRTRPYMYTDEWDEKGVESGDWKLSFPSGHTTDAFLGATFTTYTFWKYFPESKFKVPVLITSYALATTTAFMRVWSGNHFMTDVAAGAVIGSAIGFLVPFIHEKISAVKYRGQSVLSFNGQSLTATFRF